MNAIAIAFVVLSAVALVAVPRRWAALPLLAAACYMTLGQSVELGPFTFTVIRLLIGLGVLRVFLRNELPRGINALDWLMVALCFWAAFSSVFHDNVPAALVSRLGLAYNIGGIYFLLRAFCVSLDDVAHLSRLTAVVLTLVALAMVYEHVALYNVFSILGGVPEQPHIRDGRVRAFGSFAHPILAGTVGAVTLPLMIGLWSYRRLAAVIGILACLSMVVSSGSSGPVLSAMFGVVALCMWRFRNRMRMVRWAILSAYIALDIAMKAPAYYLIARIDLVGGSTGWHRARLIESAFEHLGEWWLAGTDYTRHWMPTGVDWSPDHADITNYYLGMGVIGGLPLTLLLIAMLAKSFSSVGYALNDRLDRPFKEQFMLWALGSSLVAHAATCVSVAYFDQSFVFLYLTLAVIGSVRSQRPAAAPEHVVLPGMFRRPGEAPVNAFAAMPARFGLAARANRGRVPGRRR